MLGGVSNGTIINDVNRYNATTNTWTPRAPIPGVPNAGEGPCGALWNNKIYVAQGTPAAPSTSTTSRPTPGRRAPTGRSPTATAVPPVRSTASCTWPAATPRRRSHRLRHRDQHLVDRHCAALGIFLSGYQTVGNYLYVVGGFTPSGVNSTATMRLDMTTGTWSSGPPSATAGRLRPRLGGDEPVRPGR